MHFGQRESVSRGQPNGGFAFCQLFRSGLSDHLGVKDSFWLILFTASNTFQAAFAATVTAFSTYLIGLCISFYRLKCDALKPFHVIRTISTNCSTAFNSLSVERDSGAATEKESNCGHSGSTGENGR